MILIEEDIKNLPVISEEELKEEFYEDGEFEKAVLSDFNNEADLIDKNT